MTYYLLNSVTGREREEENTKDAQSYGFGPLAETGGEVRGAAGAEGSFLVTLVLTCVVQGTCYQGRDCG